MYTFLANHGCCDICSDLNEEHFNVDEMMPGLNAPPMHPNCRCSTAPHIDRTELDEILDFVEQGGTYEEWNAQKLQQKMASTESEKNDWSETVSRQITKQERKELISYAAERGIKIPDLKQFDGDPDLLRAEIDTLSKMATEYPIGKNIVVSVSSSMPDEDFAVTVGEHITLNAKALRSRRITERNIIGGFFSSTCAEDIVVHEYGHIISSNFGNKGLEIAGKAYYNIHGEELSGGELLRYLEHNVSEYSTLFKKGKRTEITPEILAKNNSNPDEFTEEFVKLLKEVSFK